MKILGSISPEFNDNNEVINAQYINGKIIAFTHREVSILSMLQMANENIGLDWSKYDMFKSPTNDDISDAMKCVWAFVEARFQINKFQETINYLRDMLTKIDKLEEIELNEL